MSNRYGSETPPIQVRELARPPTKDDSVTSEGDLPAGAERCETKEVSEEGEARRPRPEMPDPVFLVDVYFERDKVYTQKEKTEAWSSAAKMVETYSDEMITRWKEEIDTYLVFAGLFSAVLTTFNVQSYLLLQPAAPDPSIAVLQQISSQLASFSINPPFVNSTQPSRTIRTGTKLSPPVPRCAVWLNALWFSGLILSLTSASVSIMVKQWLNEYTSSVSGTSRPVARVRQYRLNNLRRWRVEDVIVAIPILLQLSLALFLAGILILLWTLNDTVAVIASTLVGLLAVFTIVTTIIPLVNHECAYVTPQIRAVSTIWQPKRSLYWVCSSVSAWCHTTSECLDNIHSVAFAMRSLGSVIERPAAWKEHEQTWQGRERSTIDRRTGDLDKQILVEAYSTTLSQDALSAASICLMNFESGDVVDYFKQLHRSAREHFGATADSEDDPLGYGNQQQMLWLYTILCALWEDQSDLSDDEAAPLGIYFRSGSWSTGMQASDAAWAVSTCNALLEYLETAGTSSAVKFLDQDRLLNVKADLINSAMGRDKPLTNVLLLTVAWEYRQVRLKRSRLTEGSSENAEAAHTRYLQSVEHFLDYANQALTSSLPANDLEIVRAYTRDVLTDLTRTLLALFSEDKVRKFIQSYYFCDVVWSLSNLNNALVEQCVPDDFVPDILSLAEKLETASNYNDDNSWTALIQQRARIFKVNVIRVKHKPGTTATLEPSHIAPSAPDAVAVASSDNASSSSAVVPPDSLQEEHTANSDGASP